MKKLIFCVLTVLAVSLVLNSCKKEEESFDETLLYGTWKQIDGSTNLFYTYNSGGTGKYWYNTQPENLHRDITWTLDKSSFTIKHKSNDGTWDSPEYFTIISLTSTTLKFKDVGGDEYTQTKISK